MYLYDYVLSDENIYLAIYAVKSYVFEPQLLDIEDRELLYRLADPFDEVTILDVIDKVKFKIKNVLKNKDYFFKTEVYFKPKDYDRGSKQFKYRPIHTAKLEDLIAMVALLHPLIYEIPSKDNGWKLNLSNYSRLIPNNFYGNRVSKKPEELFKKWSEQYKKYTQKANEYFKTFHESKEYKYEVKLDLKNFFPSVNPIKLYYILKENFPVTLVDEDEATLKKIIYKLTVCQVTNLNDDKSREVYYENLGEDNKLCNYTVGIPQGLPQSYFLGNICMIKVAEIFEKYYECKAVYYVDDSYIYTNKEIKDDNFENQICQVNDIIEAEFDKYGNDRKDISKYWDEKCVDYIDKTKYKIMVHSSGKSTYTEIQKTKDGEFYLLFLSREASQIGVDINLTYSNEEDEVLLKKVEALVLLIEAEINKASDQKRDSYKEKLERYYKFFKYRRLKLRLKTENKLDDNIYEILRGKCEGIYEKIKKEIISNNICNYKIELNSQNKELLQVENKLKCEITPEQFIQFYKNDIWQVAMSILIANTCDEIEKIKKYIKYINDTVYGTMFKKCSYIKRMYYDNLNELKSFLPISDKYFMITKKIKPKLFRFTNMNNETMKREFSGVILNGLDTKELLKSFNILTERYLNISRIVNNNSDRLKRIFLNAIYSTIFKFCTSDDFCLNFYDKKSISYGEVRILTYLRNENCNIDKFLKWDFDFFSKDNMQNVDYAIFEVIGIFKKYIKLPEQIDDLILVHKYTCDVWKNGAKHLYFYTLHNQEHAVDLIKNIVKLTKIFSYLKITSYDYYLLFISCYLHDISMVRIASQNDFLLDNDEADRITTKLDMDWSKCKNTNETKKVIVNTYKEIDNFFENKIRSTHAFDSAQEIRLRDELNFLENSVRENVSEISEGHMLDVRDIYYLKGEGKNKLVSIKFDKILLRLADLLDMSERRVSKPILNHNIDNMSKISAFHWVSHLLTENYSFDTKYEYINNSNRNDTVLSPGNITETIILSIYVSLSQLSKMQESSCKYGKIVDSTVDSTGFEIELPEKDVCKSSKCNFLCKWFNEKNYYLIQEMNELQSYLSRVPINDRFYNTKIKIRVVISNPTKLPDEQFEILKNKINN